VIAQCRPLNPASASQVAVRFEDGAIVSLKRADDAFDTDYVQSERRLGDAIVRYRRDGDWEQLDTAEWTGERTVSPSDNGSTHGASYRICDGSTPILDLNIGFVVEDEAIRWNIALANLTAEALEIGDVAIPLPMNGNFRQQPTTAVLKHSFISGHGSFLFWMRRNSVGPYLTMTPAGGTKLEYWESQGGYRVFIHSAAAGAAARERGTAWRQPHTSATLAPRGDAGAAAVTLASHGDANAQGFSPFGRVIEGMDVVDSLYSGYGNDSGGGLRAGMQGPLEQGGNAYLAREYPELDYIIRARIRP
jgi:hypothetical protein